MSKICQCKKDAIKKICLLHRNNFLLNCKENGFWFWLIDNLQKAYESDCVCEKKEENENESNYTTSPQSCRVCGTTEVTTLVHGACLSCIGVLVRESVMKEKQSQSPCEHKWEREFFLAETITNTGHYLRPIWCCYKEGCGLVTCIDPNDTQ